MLIVHFYSSVSTVLIFFLILSWSGMNGRLLKLFEKRGRVQAHIRFCLECKRLNIIPKGFFTKSNILTAKRTQILERKFAFRRMLEEIRHSHGKLNNINAEIEKLKLEVAVDSDSLKAYTGHQSVFYHRMFQRKKKKLIILKREKMQVKLDSVVNLSDRHLTEEEMYVLALGFNFQPKFPGLPIEDIIASVEALSRKLPSDTSAQLRVGLFFKTLESYF